MQQVTDEQIDKIGTMLRMARDAHEERGLWNRRVWGRMEETWERINELEREASELKRSLYSVFKLLQPQEEA
jgi:hypothetical protein